MFIAGLNAGPHQEIIDGPTTEEVEHLAPEHTLRFQIDADQVAILPRNLTKASSGYYLFSGIVWYVAERQPEEGSAQEVVYLYNIYDPIEGYYDGERRSGKIRKVEE